MRSFRKFGFSVKESGVGGILVVVPIERLEDGGEVGRRERMCVFGEVGEGWMYYVVLSTQSIRYEENATGILRYEDLISVSRLSGSSVLLWSAQMFCGMWRKTFLSLLKMVDLEYRIKIFWSSFNHFPMRKEAWICTSLRCTRLTD